MMYYQEAVDADEYFAAAFEEHELSVCGHGGSDGGDDELEFVFGQAGEVLLQVQVFLFEEEGAHGGDLGRGGGYVGVLVGHCGEEGVDAVVEGVCGEVGDVGFGFGAALVVGAEQDLDYGGQLVVHDLTIMDWRVIYTNL
jgi:hypothetical protein